MKREIWTPVAFYNDFGREENDIVNCLDGSTKEKFSVGQFWKGFQNVAGMFWSFLLNLDLAFEFIYSSWKTTCKKHLTRLYSSCVFKFCIAVTEHNSQFKVYQ